MSLNIKNPETHRLATELARRTNVSMTEAVTEALREKLAALDAEDSAEARIAKISAIASECASRLSPEVLALDHGELLYDEKGLPK
jgi:antitoxin VapB